MVDEVTSGPPEGQRRWSTPLIVVLMVLVLVVALVHQLTSGGHPAARPTRSPTASRTPPTLPPNPLLSQPVETVSPAAGDLGDSSVPSRLIGVASEPPAGLSLLLGGAQLTRVGSRASAVGTVPVGRGERIVNVRPIGTALLVTVLMADLEQDKPYAKIYLLRNGAAARLLVRTDQAFPSFDGHSVFAMRYGASAQDPSTVTRIDLNRAVLARHQLSDRWSLDGDSPAGLLAQESARNPAPGQLSALVLLDPHTFAVRRHLGKVGYVVGAAGAKAAWTDSDCAAGCHLVVADLVKGTRRTVPGEPGFGNAVAAFSPDGRQMAVAYYGRHAAVGAPAAAGFVDVVDLATGVRHRVPGVATAVKRVADLAWTPDGKWLAVVVGMPDQDYRGVGLWPRTGGRVRVLPLRVPGADTDGALLAL